MEFDRVADIKRVNFIVASLRDHLPHGGEVLDVGCGNGIITRAIGAAGYRVLGIDMSAASIRQANADTPLSNVQFRVESAEELAASGPQYDAILCSEVLEHLSRPELLLHTIHTLLKPDGVLIVTVPNGRGPRELFVTRPVQWLENSNGWIARFLRPVKRSMGYQGTTVQSSAEDLRHLQFFSKRTLIKLVLESGFRIIRLAPTNFIEQVFPFSLIVRKSKTLQQLDCAVADKLPLSWTSGFMTVWRKGE